MFKNLFIAIALVFFCAATVFAQETPPESLVNQYKDLPVKWDKRCDFHKQLNVQCLIQYDEDNDVVWLLLFDENINITEVVKVTADKKEHVLWVRFDTRS